MTTALSAAHRLGQRLDELTQVIDQLRLAEEAAIQLRQDADIAESKAYLSAEGSIENRKQEARVKTADLEFAALTAEANVRHLLRKMKEAQARIDAGRTFAADMRAEASVAGRDGTP